jgi:NAD(P)-dependent dehydrogenase (short-subunit alcohol dehydrogenase family)
MTMDIRQAGPHLSADAGRGLAKMDGTGKLSNKIALITGGTTGIGAATATRFQAEGARRALSVRQVCYRRNAIPLAEILELRERAADIESTAARERAGFRERIAGHERAVSIESIKADERADMRESAGRIERANAEHLLCADLTRLSYDHLLFRSTPGSLTMDVCA